MAINKEERSVLLDSIEESIQTINAAKKDLDFYLSSRKIDGHLQDLYDNIKEAYDCIKRAKGDLMELSLQTLEDACTISKSNTAEDLLEKIKAGAAYDSFEKDVKGKTKTILPRQFVSVLEEVKIEPENENTIMYLIKNKAFDLEGFAKYINKNSKTLNVAYNSNTPELVLPRNKWQLNLK